MSEERKRKSTAAVQSVSSLLQEFKKFALKGNVIDLAVGVIIGGAFGKIVSSLVADIIMPLIGLVLPGDKGYEGWKLVVGEKVIPYGKFLGEIVNFIVVAFALYIFIVKFLGWAMRTKQQEQPAAPAGPPPLTADQQLLTEIRDLLQKR